ncbi:UNVERIFIED_CONTAM: hypothetical protein Sradi_0205500 [Sesamum radiatum]|uniref:Uncharacterized protein n=1 Tax=Sesamum radiatum TaxID=300843 RepID=A0AAW2W144_SESRA
METGGNVQAPQVVPGGSGTTIPKPPSPLIKPPRRITSSDTSLGELSSALLGSTADDRNNHTRENGNTYPNPHSNSIQRRCPRRGS